MNKCLLSALALMFTLLFVSCSGAVPPMQRDYPDAVTNINQVDPYYRSYFRAQNGSNYSLADQRSAYLAAMQTARTPVRASDYRRAADTRLASRRTSRATRGRATSSRRAVATRGSKARRGTSARRGTTARNRRATVSRRSSARRGTRRRG